MAATSSPVGGFSPSRLLAFYQKRPIVRMYVTLGLTLLTITFFAVFAIRPTVVTITNLIDELNQKKQLTATLDSKISAVFAAQSVYADAVANLGVLDSSLPSTPALGGVLDQIQLLAETRRVKIRSLSFEQFSLLGGPVPGTTNTRAKRQTTDTSSVTAYPFTLSVVGPYSNLYGFVADVENLRRIVILKGFGITLSQSDTGGQTLTLTISGEVSSLAKPTTASH